MPSPLIYDSATGLIVARPIIASDDAFASGVPGPSATAAAARRIRRDFTSSEPVSGVRAIQLLSGGFARTAMAAVSGRMPAAGMYDTRSGNIASGALFSVLLFGEGESPGVSIPASGDGRVWVGRSGTLEALPASSSGDLQQILGVVIFASGLIVMPNLDTVQVGG